MNMKKYRKYQKQQVIIIVINNIQMLKVINYQHKEHQINKCQVQEQCRIIILIILLKLKTDYVTNY